MESTIGNSAIPNWSLGTMFDTANVIAEVWVRVDLELIFQGVLVALECSLKSIDA